MMLMEALGDIRSLGKALEVCRLPQEALGGSKII